MIQSMAGWDVRSFITLYLSFNKNKKPLSRKSFAETNMNTPYERTDIPARNRKDIMWCKSSRKKLKEASLTVEAALVLPIFLYFMLAFLYFIQIFTVQEKIQSAITKMGLNLSRTAYVLKDFPSLEDALSFDFSIFGNEFEICPGELVDNLLSGGALKLYAKRYLDTDRINQSCIKGGFDGISFDQSSLSSSKDTIDIIVTYQIEMPIKLLIIDRMNMVQRIKLHKWTGYEVAAVYHTEDAKEDTKDLTVYITETGSVYHKDRSCSHIKLTVSAVTGIPDDLRNDSGGKYYPCEACCTGRESAQATFYITSDGTRYHIGRDCSKIKRSVREIKLSEVGSREPCKRCSP